MRAASRFPSESSIMAFRLSGYIVLLHLCWRGSKTIANGLLFEIVFVSRKEKRNTLLYNMYGSMTLCTITSGNSTKTKKRKENLENCLALPVKQMTVQQYFRWAASHATSWELLKSDVSTVRNNSKLLFSFGMLLNAHFSQVQTHSNQMYP